MVVGLSFLNIVGYINDAYMVIVGLMLLNSSLSSTMPPENIQTKCSIYTPPQIKLIIPTLISHINSIYTIQHGNDEILPCKRIYTIRRD
jgi:hypothetical protein